MNALDHTTMERVAARPRTARSIFGAAVIALAVSCSPPHVDTWVELWDTAAPVAEWSSGAVLHGWLVSGLVALWGWALLMSGVAGYLPRPNAFESRSDWAPGEGSQWRRVILHHPLAVHEGRESRPDERWTRWYPLRGFWGRRNSILMALVPGLLVAWSNTGVPQRGQDGTVSNPLDWDRRTFGQPVRRYASLVAVLVLIPQLAVSPHIGAWVLLGIAAAFAWWVWNVPAITAVSMVDRPAVVTSTSPPTLTYAERETLVDGDPDQPPHLTVASLGQLRWRGAAELELGTRVTLLHKPAEDADNLVDQIGREPNGKVRPASDFNRDPYTLAAFEEIVGEGRWRALESATQQSE